jgi:histidinol-phosphate aminotransferase
VRAYVEPGEEVVVPEGIFRMFPVAVGRAGGNLVEIPTKADLVPDLVALRKRISPTTKIVAIANPNNPTGAYVRRADLAEFLESVPDHVLVVLDEAYFEFASGVVADYPDGLEFLRKGKSLLILRTFSKIVGLAGLRIGYGFAPVEVAATLQKVREPFNTSLLAQAAALAALDDTAHMEKTRALVLEERAFLVRELSARGVPPHPSVANFLLVTLPRPFAPLEAEFEKRGVIVRPMGGWGFPHSFRVSVGAHAENVRFLAAVDEMQKAGLLAATPEKAVV